MILPELFCSVDDLSQTFTALNPKNTFPNIKNIRAPKLGMAPSEIMSILILIMFHKGYFRTFKPFYLQNVCIYLRAEFPNKTFKDISARGKTSVDCFFGFKLHLLFNDQGEIL